ncbi:uncharacterized mitochondrial protein AtMg00810-like [Arachis stenosperma]|uniref:uncharacterized mitochondrial protein AtMg00810-like n=1 Tax=Arachis stenosperma TaxID=217475 RepID=UPI0025AB8E88|nr:uncharacterized mitochondrial protein AtMg00810-like [Arachis stenosperma]
MTPISKNILLAIMDAIKAKLDALETNKTWILTKLPPGKKAIGCKWVIKTKFKADGSVECHNARLVANGFTQSRSDHSLFAKRTNSGFTAILVYVDDLILGGDDLAEIECIKKLLDDKFKIKDPGRLKYFLGLEVARTTQGISLYQQKYTLDLLKEYGLTNAKPASTPMNYTVTLSKSFKVPLDDLQPYRRLIGRLLYFTNTRPDICFIVSKLSQYLDCATGLHFKAGLHVLCYLKQALAKGVFFPRNSDFKLTGYFDSDWGTCPDSRRSMTG